MNFITLSLPKLVLLPVLIAGVLLVAERARAQTLTNLHNFSALTSSTNSDGAGSTAGVVLSGNTLYGTTQNGGSLSYGAIFAVNTDGTGFTNLHNFVRATDGAYPAGKLVLTNGTLYGTTQSGGSADRGTVFMVKTNGTEFAVLHSFSTGFTNSDGSGPYAGLVIANRTLYGTAFTGGTFGFGTVFSVRTNGTAFTTLHNFTGTNGANPSADLVLAGATLYGTTYQGGFTNDGTIFAVRTNGTAFTNLYTLSTTNGANPYAGLVLSGETLYGNTRYGGVSDVGTVFAISTNGTGFTRLHSFNESNGANPNANLTVASNKLFGAAYRGGNSGKGTLYSINLDGSGFTNFYHFTATTPAPPFSNADGANPVCEPVLDGGTLFGTASTGGSAGNGTVFSLSLPTPVISAPTLSIRRSGTNVILTWPTNAMGFTLHSTTNLFPPIVWSSNSAPTVVDDLNTVTNSISGTQLYYQISQ